MDAVSDTTAPPEVDTSELVATEPVETTDNSETDAPSSEDTSSELPVDETPVEEDEEIDYEGERYKVPKKLKDAFLRQSDYSRKTAEVAEQRRALEAQQQEFQRTAQLHQQNLQEHAQLMALEAQIKQFEGVDWQQLIDTDPVEAMKLDRQYRTLTDMRGQIATRVQQAQQQMALKTQQELAKRIETGREQLKREITGWSPELQANLAGYGKELGFSAEELGQVIDPRAVKMLHKAYLYDQLMKKATPKPKPPEVKPVTKVAAKSETAKRDPDKMSTDEWLKWRETELRKKRSA